jgi:hypothetical protein
MKPIDRATDVMEKLLDKGVQKELTRIDPRFDLTELVGMIFEEWPEGKVGFARSIVKEFEAAQPGGGTRQMILRMITTIISEETQQTGTRPVADLTDEELEAKIKALGPVLSRIKT